MVVKVASSVAEPDLTSKRLRLKVLVKKPANGTYPELPKVNCLKNQPIVDEKSKVGTGDENKMLGTNVPLLGACQLSKQVPKVDCGFDKSSGIFNRATPMIGNKNVNTVGLKRGSEEVLNGPVPKRLKMDRSATLLCQSVLEKLMLNQLSFPFRLPVDPVAWSIDDYFDIIKEPMDLGTIKQKLRQLKYIRAEEFEADVRLTFSNAMLYNPPSHWIHQDASNLLREFDRIWKPVKVKLDKEHKDIRQRDSDSNLDKSACNVKGEYLGSTPSHQAQISGKTLPSTEKGPGDLKKPSIQEQCVSKSSLNKTAMGRTPSHRAQLSEKTLPPTEKGPGDFKKSSIQEQCGSESSLNRTALGRTISHRAQFSGKTLPPTEKGPGDLKKSSIQEQWASKSGLDKTAMGRTPSHWDQFSGKTLPRTEKGPGDVKKSSIQVQCSDSKPVTDYNANDTSSSKSLKDCSPKDTSSKSSTECKPRKSLIPKSHSDPSGPASCQHKNACPMSATFRCDTATGNMIADNDFSAAKVKHTSTLQSDSFGLDYAGTSSFMGVDHGCANVPSTTASFCATGIGLQNKSDVELSPSRARRVAELKSRYAETIMKAQHHTLLEPGAEANIRNRQQEKDMLRRQCEETANMEAKIRAAKSAARLKEESERKRQRQEARDAARRAIRQMEQSVNVDNNFQVMRDLEALVGTSLVVMCPDRTSRTMWNYEGINNLGSPLERLGLYIKEEYSANDFDDAFLEEEPEEGELVL